MKVALITGITGQDGSYLAELLVEKGYEVHGLIRRASSYNTERIDTLVNDGANIKLHYGDLTDSSNLIGEFIAVLGPRRIRKRALLLSAGCYVLRAGHCPWP